MDEQPSESPMASVSSQSSAETPFQNEPPLSPSTTNSAEVVNRDSSISNMFDGLHSVENEYDQLLQSPYFTGSNQVTRISQGSNSNYDTESLREELDAALLASPASIANKRRVGPILVETVNEDSCHQAYSYINPAPKGRPSAEDLTPLFPAPASAPPPPPPSSVGSSSTARSPPAASAAAAAAAAPDLLPSAVSQDSDSYSDSESDDSGHSTDSGGLQKIDDRIASIQKKLYYAKSNNVEPRRSSAYDPHVDSLRRELNEAALDAPSAELAPLDEYFSSEELSIMVPQEDDAMARKYTIAAAVLVGCNCFLVIWILAMLIVLALRA
jgi:hypothetical protein